MPKFLQIATIALLGAIPSALGGNMIAINHCTFPIYCRGDINGATTEAPITLVSPGSTYVSPNPAANDNIGVVVKCDTNSAVTNPYQLEVTVDDGVTYMDLSALDGDPFLAYNRAASIPGTTCNLECDPGSTSCEFSSEGVVTCVSTGDITMTLC
ncbi:hypothetical protein F5Y16DRAFT_397355 [Xylariaceae sp. FL0255]|nr:hypothetical protein F5Y16DRAFT_397355 [Xylariaceae sp. FL0255]